MEGDLAAAIATIEDSRQTHVTWVNYWNSVECQDCERCKQEAAIAGDREHHEQCIDGYNNVLEVLYWLRREEQND